MWQRGSGALVEASRFMEGRGAFLGVQFSINFGNVVLIDFRLFGSLYDSILDNFVYFSFFVAQDLLLICQCIFGRNFVYLLHVWG